MFGHVLFTGEWWKNSLIRALRTALVIAAAYVPGTLSESIPYTTILLAGGLGFVLSFLTSVAGIPEADGENQPAWLAILSRVAKSVAQAAIVACGTATLITEVNWGMVGAYALSAGFGSLVLAVMSNLPEVGDDATVVNIQADSPGALGTARSIEVTSTGPIEAVNILEAPEVITHPGESSVDYDKI